MNLLKHKIKNSLIFSFIIYLLINFLVFSQGQYYENKLENYDLNKSGFFEKNERTEKQQIAMKRVTSDTARNLAPFTTIPIIIFFGIIFWLVLKILDKKEKDLDTVGNIG